MKRRFLLSGAAAAIAAAGLPRRATGEEELSVAEGRRAKAGSGPDYYFPPSETSGGWRSLVTPGQTPSAAQQAAIRDKVGLDWAGLKLAYDYSRSFTASTDLLVIRNGWVAAEWGRGAPFAVASISKSLTGLTVAKLLDLAKQGTIGPSITLKSPLYPFLPSTWAAADPRRRLIQIGHVLSMTSGLLPNDTPEEPNHLAVILSQPVRFAPAKSWSYASLPVDLLGIAVQNLSGKPLRDLFNQHVAAGIGIPPTAWGSFSGYTKACDGASLTARDLARVGYLMLKNGAWNDGTGQRQVVSKSGIQALHKGVASASKAAFAPTPGSPFPIDDTSPAFYGELWWTNRTKTGLGPAVPTDAFYARGYREALLVVVPSLDLIVVRYGNLPLGLAEFGASSCRAIMAAVTG